LDEAGKKKFIKDYKEYYINTQIAPTQPLLKPDKDQVSFIEKAEEPAKGSGKGSGKAGGAKSGTARVLSDSDVSAAIQNYNALVADPDSEFTVNFPGPKGGKGIDEKFYVNSKGQIVSDRNPRAFSRKTLKKYLESKTKTVTLP
jgi:hypothetical protein